MLKTVQNPLLIFIVVFIFYYPSIENNYIWDDDDYVTENKTLRSIEGLKKIWFKPGSVPQYYPLVHSTYWLEYQIWGLNSKGYHLVNILLHIFNALLLFIILKRLNIPGAFLASFIFALHPVHVESVAWITERKNTLSAFFYLSSLYSFLIYSKIDSNNQNSNIESKSPQIYYWLSFLLFICALLSKTITCSLPVVFFIIYYYKNIKINFKALIKVVPFILIGILFGLITIWMEKYSVKAEGPEWKYSFLERILIAGHAVWFYLYKLILPVNLTFIYPKWDISIKFYWQYVYAIFIPAMLIILWVLKNKFSKGPLCAFVFFLITISPALGFINIYPMRYTFVADHYQYIASMGPIILFSSFIVYIFSQVEILKAKYIKLLLFCALIIILGINTSSQTMIYKNETTLWVDTLEKNPKAWMAYNNLGNTLLKKDQIDKAEELFMEAIRLNPKFHEAYNNLGAVNLSKGHIENAILNFEHVLKLHPDSEDALTNLGLVYGSLKMPDKALEYFKKALRTNPDSAKNHNNAGAAYYQLGDKKNAIVHFKQAIKLDPNFDRAQINLKTVTKKNIQN